MNYTIGVQNLAPLMDLQILCVEKGPAGGDIESSVSVPKTDCANTKKMMSKINESH